MNKNNERYQYYYYRSNIADIRVEKKTNYTKRYILSFLLLLSIGLFAGDRFYHNHAKALSLSDSKVVKTSSVALQTPIRNSNSLVTLNNSVNSVINNNPGITFGVSINNINDGSQLNYGQTGPMTSASVSKILTATDFLKQVELGNESIDETLDDGNKASVDLNSMITVSDDNAWEALNDEVSYSQLQTYADQLGLTSYDADTNSLSPSDTADLLTRLYEGKLLNASDTQLVLSYMLNANYRTYIIPAVPSYDTVYHKVGFIDDDVNDTAIITNGKQTIVLSIYTDGNGSYDWTARASLIQKITTAVLNYYKLN